MVTGVPNITNVPGYEVNQFVLDIRFQILRCSSWGLKLVDPAGPRVEPRLHRHEREEVATVAVTYCGSRHRPRVRGARAMPGSSWRGS